jgi:hypothetical protein
MKSGLGAWRSMLDSKMTAEELNTGETLEYPAFASMPMRRLDRAEGRLS